MSQRRKPDGQRPRISVSLDQEDCEWLMSFNEGLGVAHSASFLVARVIKAARAKGIVLNDATVPAGSVAGFHDWLSKRKRKGKVAQEVQELLADYLAEE